MPSHIHDFRVAECVDAGWSNGGGFRAMLTAMHEDLHDGCGEWGDDCDALDQVRTWPVPDAMRVESRDGVTVLCVAEVSHTSRLVSSKLRRWVEVWRAIDCCPLPLDLELVEIDAVSGARNIVDMPACYYAQLSAKA